MTDRRRLLVPGADSLRLDYLPGRTHLCKGRAGGGPWRMPIHCVPYIGCVSRPRNRGPSTLPYELDRLEVCSYEYLRLAYRGEKDEAKSARICRCRRHVSAEGVACWYDRCQLNTFLGADEDPSSRASAVSFCNEDMLRTALAHQNTGWDLDFQKLSTGRQRPHPVSESRRTSAFRQYPSK